MTTHATAATSTPTAILTAAHDWARLSPGTPAFVLARADVFALSAGELDAVIDDDATPQRLRIMAAAALEILRGRERAAATAAYVRDRAAARTTPNPWREEV